MKAIIIRDKTLDTFSQIIESNALLYTCWAVAGVAFIVFILGSLPFFGGR